MMFVDREDAGRQLAVAVKDRLFEADDVIVLGLPRGGVIVAREVARLLGKPLDAIVTRKIGAPGLAELAIGAVGESGMPILDYAAIASYRIPGEYLTRATVTAGQEIKRRIEAYRAGVRPDVRQKTVVLVDDGIATGYTIEAAIATLREWGAQRIFVAVPVATRRAVTRLQHLVDDVVALHAPDEFFAVGEFYRDFPEVSDERVMAALRELSVAVT
jgi:predicted phosphoribosyltransferase